MIIVTKIRKKVGLIPAGIHTDIRTLYLSSIGIRTGPLFILLTAGNPSKYSINDGPLKRQDTSLYKTNHP